MNVRVVMTESACRFVTPLTFAAITREKVFTSIFPETFPDNQDVIYPHLYPASEADAFAVIPATANIIAKLAHGMGDDIVCCSALALKPDCKRIFCPAMNAQMWAQRIVKENTRELLRQGWHQIGPESGRMACGGIGMGRLSSPSAITEVILNSVL